MRNRFILLRLLERFFLSMADVDWGRTVAYSQGNYGQIFLNLAGREPEGIVAPADYDDTCARLIEDLKALEDPLTGKPIVEKVFRRDDIYTGDYVDYAPDIGFLLADGYKALGTLAFSSNRVVRPVFGNSGDHRMDGILLMSGPPVRKGHQLERASIMDIAPTILYLMGLPVEKRMDGKALLGALKPEYVEGHPIAFADSGSDVARDETPYSDEEAEELRDRLRNLGYWG
jgi:predicted AlkP superfamily phosphohydrolase/phosphomutase